MNNQPSPSYLAQHNPHAGQLTEARTKRERCRSVMFQSDPQHVLSCGNLGGPKLRKWQFPLSLKYWYKSYIYRINRISSRCLATPFSLNRRRGRASGNTGPSALNEFQVSTGQIIESDFIL